MISLGKTYESVSVCACVRMCVSHLLTLLFTFFPQSSLTGRTSSDSSNSSSSSSSSNSSNSSVTGGLSTGPHSYQPTRATSVLDWTAPDMVAVTDQLKAVLGDLDEGTLRSLLLAADFDVERAINHHFGTDS